jgi:hypothetical protein
MKKLFTKQIFVEPNFLHSNLLQHWEEMIWSNLKIFGTDVEPGYGQMAAFYGMMEAGLNESKQ